MSLRLRRATPADAGKLAIVGCAGMLESFADDHPGDDMVAHIESHHSRAFYDAKLADPAISLWLVEEAAGSPVGYAMAGPAKLPGSGEQDYELIRIYMLYRWHGTGFGRALFDAVVAQGQAEAKSRLVLSVYSKNTKARTFYGRNGFVEVGPVTFMVGSTPFDDIVMTRDL